ncbi:MAG: mechanosensitive ion channel family protein [Paludibacteraceae bacterium]
MDLLQISESINTTINSLQTFVNTLIASIGEWTPRVVGGLIALITGLWLINFLIKLLKKSINKSNFDRSLQPFIVGVVNFTLKVLLIITVIGIIGIQTTSFAVILGAIGLAIGTAFNGSLGNLASGIMILIFRPFKVGDLIEINSEMGIVSEISIFVTILETPTNKTILIPNGTVTSSVIKNYTRLGSIRLDIPFAVRYGSDLNKVKSLVTEAARQQTNILENPTPTVVVNNLGVNGIELNALLYVNKEAYWDVYFGMRQEIINVLSENGFKAPLSQHVVNQEISK